MFVERVSGPVRDWEAVKARSGLLADPPDGLLSCVVLPDGDGRLTATMVWESPGQRGDWAAEVMMPLFESGQMDDVGSHPEPVEPIDLFVREVDRR
jgi:hypothetical protein